MERVIGHHYVSTPNPALITQILVLKWLEFDNNLDWKNLNLSWTMHSCIEMLLFKLIYNSKTHLEKQHLSLW